MTADNLAPQLIRGARPDRVAAAVRFWADGDFAACLQQLDCFEFDDHTSESILIRARALLRLDRLEEAESWLHVTAPKHATADTRATFLMLAGSAAGRLRKPALAHDLFVKADAIASHKSVRAELSYYRALEHWQNGRNAQARAALAQALDPAEDIIFARALSLVGWTHVSERRYVDGARVFGEALEALRRCRHKDAHLHATLLQASAIAIAELPGGDPQNLANEIENFRWTAGELEEHFQSQRHIGLAFIRRGHAEPAFRHFVRAADLAPRTAWAVLSFADCAAGAGTMNEPHAARAFLQLACAAADHVDWGLVDGEPRLALLQLALALGRAGKGRRASRFLALFGESAHFEGLSALQHDPRVAIYRRHVEAVVRIALGDASGAADLAAVRRSWAEIGYHWRAIEAESDSAASIGLAGSVATFSNQQAACVDIQDRQMTDEKRRLLRLVLEGRSRKEIAEHLNLSVNTVRNYLSVLYQMFQVSGRPELIARCLRDDRVLEAIAR